MRAVFETGADLGLVEGEKMQAKYKPNTNFNIVLYIVERSRSPFRVWHTKKKIVFLAKTKNKKKIQVCSINI